MDISNYARVFAFSRSLADNARKFISDQTTVTKASDFRRDLTPVKPGLSISAWRKVMFNASPKYWALALILIFCNALALLPKSLLILLGKGLGKLIAALSPQLRHIVNRNIDACFSSLSPQERSVLKKRSFRELGISVMETLLIWFGDAEKLYRGKTDIAGEQHLNAALAQSRGIILLACHHGSLDMNASFGAFTFRPHRKYVFTYRQPSDKVVDLFLQEARGKFADGFYAVNNLVGILRALKRGGVVWYAPDIEVKNKNSNFADFMGVPASTTVALAKIALSSKALVLPYGHYRQEDGRYTLQFYAPLENFPSGDAAADTRKMNEAIETIVQAHPDRYWWVIKRFKHRPEGVDKIY